MHTDAMPKEHKPLKLRHGESSVPLKENTRAKVLLSALRDNCLGINVGRVDRLLPFSLCSISHATRSRLLGHTLTPCGVRETAVTIVIQVHGQKRQPGSSRGARLRFNAKLHTHSHTSSVDCTQDPLRLRLDPSTGEFEPVSKPVEVWLGDALDGTENQWVDAQISVEGPLVTVTFW